MTNATFILIVRENFDMTDPTHDTPKVARSYCPGCEPNADPLKKILEVQWCEIHIPPRGGLDDITVTASGSFNTASAEAGGENNRAWCNLIHRNAEVRNKKS